MNTINQSVTVLFILVLPTVFASRHKSKECSPFPFADLEHGNITTAGPQKYTFRCERGYFLTSPQQVRCWKGKWSSSRQPKCSRSEGFCDDPPSIDSGEILGDERHVGSVIQYMCKPGHVLMGEGKRNCLRSGYWSGLTPSCMDESKNDAVQNVAERLKNKFVSDVGSFSTDSVVPQGRLLDRDSIQRGLELVILIDRSSSVDPKDFKVGIRFVKFLLQQFGVKNGKHNSTGTRATVIAFGTNVDILFDFENDTITGPLAASKALDTLQAGGGGTAMQEALITIFTHLPDPRFGAKRAIFMMTDGEPNIGTVEDTLFFARQLREEKDFEIFTIGIGRGINRQLLSHLASEPAINHVFVLDKYTDLQGIMQAIKDKPQGGRISSRRCGYIREERNYLKRWPWLSAVYIGLPNEAGPSLAFCTGTLICSQWVLTAASCFFHLQKTNVSQIEIRMIDREVFVVLGERDMVHEDRNQMNFYVESVTIHPDFSPLDSLQHNLALIRINAPAPMGPFRPACLPLTDRPILLHQDLNTNVSIAGWGLSSWSEGDSLEMSGGRLRLQSVNITAVLEEESECKRLAGRTEKENIFCAGGHGSQTCIGDIGSPIIAVDPSTNFHHVIGVLSKKNKCHLGINHYTKINPYIRWINGVTERCQLQHYMV